MKLYKDDLIKFHELLKHYNETSPNIAVIGDKKTFKKLVKEVLSRLNFDVLVVNRAETKYTILIDDIEISYVHVETLEDLEGLYFSKYV